MNYEEALRYFENRLTCGQCGENTTQRKAFEVAIEALEKQNNIVHCKDCENWKTISIETLDGRKAEAGQCTLTGWLCGEQGFCMYGREV